MPAIKKIIGLALIVITSCKEPQKASMGFSTYYIVSAEHEIVFYEHYIYLDKFNRSDSANYLVKVIHYVDTVKLGRPVGAISIINNIDYFPKSLDDINWQRVSKSKMMYVSFNEDSLKEGKYFISEVEFPHSP